jgi:hypothetical protein
MCRHNRCWFGQYKERGSFKSTSARINHECIIEHHSCYGTGTCGICEGNEGRMKKTTDPQTLAMLDLTSLACRHTSCFAKFANTRSRANHEAKPHEPSKCTANCPQCDRRHRKAEKKKSCPTDVCLPAPTYDRTEISRKLAELAEHVTDVGVSSRVPPEWEKAIRGEDQSLFNKLFVVELSDKPKEPVPLKMVKNAIFANFYELSPNIPKEVQPVLQGKMNLVLKVLP